MTADTAAPDALAPIAEKSLDASKAAYDRLFSDVARYVRIKLKWRGIHSLIAHELGDRLDGADVMDIGCGYGRFCFLAARRARRVVGIDMTPQAFAVAGALKSALKADNVDFALTEVEAYDPGAERFDVVVLGGVLEHLIDPASVMETIGRMLKPGGLLVSNSPTESNFRGDVSTALWKLFDFPMSLSDVRLVSHRYMRELAAQYGYEPVRTLGVSYERAWGRLGAEDLQARLPNVLRDVAGRLGGMTVDQAAFDAWVAERAAENQALLDDWKARGVLKRIPDRAPFELDAAALTAAGLPADALAEYLAPDFSVEPWWTDQAPYNAMGGQSVFILQKQ